MFCSPAKGNLGYRRWPGIASSWSMLPLREELPLVQVCALLQLFTTPLLAIRSK